MNVHRIFVCDMGEFRNHKKYEFVADFADKKVATQYVIYMRDKKRYANKDIVIKAVPIGAIDVAEGTVAGVITVMGEDLPVEEYEFI